MVPRWPVLLLLCTLLGSLLRPALAQRTAPSAATAFSDAVQLYEQGLYPDAGAALAAFRASYPTHVQSAESLFLEAKSTLAAERDTETLRLLDRLQRRYPRYPRAQEARLGLAQRFLDRGEQGRGKEQLQRIAEDPSGPSEGARALYMLARTEQQQGNLQAALTHFDRVLRRYPQADVAPAALYATGVAHVQLKRFDDATASFERLGEQYPESPFSQNLGTILGEVYYRLDRFEDAVAELEERLPNLNGEKRARANYLLAESYSQLGNRESAVSRYRTVLDAHAGSPYATAARYGLAWQQYDGGNYAAAAESFAQVQASNSPHAEAATYYEAVSLARAGDTGRALTQYRTLLDATSGGRLAAEARYEVGLLQYQREEYAAAAAAFRALVRNFSSSERVGEAYYWLGNAYLANDQLDRALEAYDQAVERGAASESVRIEVQFQKAWSLHRNGQYEEAATEFVSLVKSYPDTPRTREGLLWAGDSFFQIGDYSRARTLLQQFLDADVEGTQRAGARYALAWTYFKQRQFSAAARHFRQFLDSYEREGNIPYRQDARLRLADCYFALKRYDDAIAVYRRVDGQGTDYALYQAGKGLYYADRPQQALDTLERFAQQYPDSPWRPDALYRMADIHFQQQNYDAAREGFRRLVQEYPTHDLAAEAQYAIGDSYYNAGDMELAVEGYRTVLLEYPENPTATEAASSLFFALNAAGQQDRAEEVIRSIAEKSSDEDMAERLRFERARAAYQSGQSKRALRLFREFVRTSTVDELLPSAYYHLGLLYADLDQEAEATTYLRQLLDQYPGSDEYANAALRLGDIYLDDGSYEQAAQTYRGAAENEETSDQLRAQARYGQSMALLQLERPGEAEDLLSQILDAQGSGPLQASARLGLGRIREQQGQSSEALDLYRTVAESATSETGAEALFRLGHLYREQGEARTAIRELDRMSALFGGYPEWEARALLEQARAYRDLGETGQAVQLYDEVVDSFSGTPFAETARQERESISTAS